MKTTENIEQLVMSFYAIKGARESGLEAIRALDLTSKSKEGIDNLNFIEDGFLAIQKAVDRIESEVYEREGDCLAEHTRKEIQESAKMIEDIITDNIPPKIKPIPSQPAIDEMYTIVKLAGYR